MCFHYEDKLIARCTVTVGLKEPMYYVCQSVRSGNGVHFSSLICFSDFRDKLGSLAATCYK